MGGISFGRRGPCDFADPASIGGCASDGESHLAQGLAALEIAMGSSVLCQGENPIVHYPQLSLGKQRQLSGRAEANCIQGQQPLAIVVGRRLSIPSGKGKRRLSLRL